MTRQTSTCRPCHTAYVKVVCLCVSIRTYIIIIVILITVLTSTVFTRRSYEYQILLENPSWLALSLYMKLNNNWTATSRLVYIESKQNLTRVYRRGPTGGTRFLFTTILPTINCFTSRCPSRCPIRHHLPHNCHRHHRHSLPSPPLPPPPPLPPLIFHLSLCRIESMFSNIPEEVKKWEPGSHFLISLLPLAVIHAVTIYHTVIVAKVIMTPPPYSDPDSTSIGLIPHRPYYLRTWYHLSKRIIHTHLWPFQFWSRMTLRAITNTVNQDPP